MATKPQPYRLDWQGPAKSLEEANQRLRRLWTSADEMFEILFKGLSSTDATATAASTRTLLTGPVGIPGLDGFDGEDGPQGQIGPSGAVGAAGLLGLQGPPGVDGDVGDDGGFILTIPPSVDLANQTQGVLPVGRGGTGTSTTFTKGSVIFAGTSGAYSQDNTNFFWDATNHYLGIGTASPGSGIGSGVVLDVASASVPTLLRLLQTGSAELDLTLSRTGGTVNSWSFYLPSGSTDLRLYSGGDKITIQSSGNFGINNTNPKLFQVGSSNFTVDSAANSSDGAVGVGTGTPATGKNVKLDVISGSVQTLLRLVQTGTGENNLNFSRTGGTASDWSFYLPSGSSDMRMYSGSDRVFLQSGGNVGIGASPNTLFSVNEKFQVNSSGLVPKYNNVSTTAWGLPSIYGQGRSTAQTGAVAAAAAYTVGSADGTFFISSNVNVTAYTAGTVTVACDYTDETNTARTFTFTFSNLTGTLLTAIGATGPYEGFPAHIRCKASTSITVKTTVSLFTGTYNVEGYILQIG